MSSFRAATSASCCARRSTDRLTIRRGRWLAAAALILSSVTPWGGAAGSTANDIRKPIEGGILFLPQPERDRRFGAMERYYTGHLVRAGGHTHALPPGPPLALPPDDTRRFMATAHIAGLIVVQHGRVRLERYAAGRTAHDRWTTFSVTKSVTSTLIGAAIRARSIRSIDDRVTTYLPALRGSAYDGVTIAQLLTMTSGVRWNEDYADPHADVVRLYETAAPAGEDRTVAYLRRLPRAYPPGMHWSYNTGEIDLAGVLLRAATHRSLADLLSHDIWQRYGMADDAYWLTDAQGHEAGGSGLSISVRDAARLGALALDGGGGVVAPGWFGDATRPHQSIGGSGDGYGYLWWTYPGGRFAARGIFGQSILIDRATRTVIAIAADWSSASDPAAAAARARFEQAVLSAVRKR